MEFNQLIGSRCNVPARTACLVSHEVRGILNCTCTISTDGPTPCCIPVVLIGSCCLSSAGRQQLANSTCANNAGPADRTDRRRLLHDAIAAGAAQLWTYMPDHLKNANVPYETQPHR